MKEEKRILSRIVKSTDDTLKINRLARKDLNINIQNSTNYKNYFYSIQTYKTMKKTLLLFAIAILVSCSSDDESTNSKNSSINPPNWIQGKWFQENNGTIDKNTG